MAVTVLESLNQSLHRMFERDSRVHLIGEDLLDPYGGAFKVSKGLSTRYPGRVWTTPISEAAIVGVAVGMALRGLRPIAEIMFGDFLTLASDQIINHAAKFRWMFNDSVTVPLVIRAPMGGRRGYGPTHSQSLEKHFLGVPGLWVVAPSLCGEPGRLLEQAALEIDDPVLFVESKTCYGKALVDSVAGMTCERLVSPEDPFETLHFTGTRRSSDGLVCCYGAMTPVALEAVAALAETEGLHLDLAVFSQLSPSPRSHVGALLDRGVETCVILEEASVTGGWSSDVTAVIEEERDRAGAPAIRYGRLGARHQPIASSRVLEQECLPCAADVVAAVLAKF
jgi:pyruvate/2-oxoglutarate/acetoin dehydrogenase E1 component